MCCQPKETLAYIGMSVCDCGCAPAFRRFFSSKEEKECLETYRGQLEKELAGLKERIENLKKK